jgi:hypothetical protein
MLLGRIDDGFVSLSGLEIGSWFRAISDRFDRRIGERMQYPFCAFGNENVYIVYPRETNERLSTRCFRGTLCRTAGNFFRWDNFDEFRSDPLVIDALREAVANQIEGANGKLRIKGRLEIDCGEEIGWSSTDPSFKYEGWELEQFEVNFQVDGFRLHASSNRLAPLTKFVTLVYVLCHEVGDMNWKIMMYSIHPGVDIGPLEVVDGEENVSCREGVVFFDYEHPGR